MKFIRISFIAGWLVAGAFPVYAEPVTEGVIREVNRGTQQIRIDERRYRLTAGTRIRNYIGGTDHLWSLKPGQPVRYSVAPDKTIGELWVLPADTRELERLKLMRDPGD